LEGKSKFNNFSVQYFGGAGIVNGKNSVSGSVTVFQVLFEYQPVNSNLGFRAGINSYSYSVTKTSQWNQAILAAYYSPQLFLAYTAVSNNFLPAQSTQGYGFDTILDYHFQPRKPFDPYLFVGIGIGSCANACSVYRGTIGAGFKANLHDGYFIAEAFGEKPNFIFTQQFFTPSFNLFSYGLKFGFGIYLDI
jgi:hypothetical protein